MSIEQEILAIVNQIIPTIEKAFFEAMVYRHPGHGNQKTHGNRYGGYGVTKESLRRLKDDKGEREKYKDRARKKQGGDKGTSREKTLKSIESEIRKQGYETAAIVDKNGKVLLRKDGGKDYVSFTDEEVALMKGQTITHNHPGDNSFSREDGYMLAHAGLAEIRAVGEKWTHSLKTPPGKTLDPERVREVVSKIDGKVYDYFWGEIYSGKISTDEASARHFHEVWTQASKELGLDYSRKAV